MQVLSSSSSLDKKSRWRRGNANWPAVFHLQLSTPSADLSDRSFILVKVLGSHAWTKSTLQLVKRNEGKKGCKQICLLNGVAPDLLSHRYLLTGRGLPQFSDVPASLSPFGLAPSLSPFGLALADCAAYGRHRRGYHQGNHFRWKLLCTTSVRLIYAQACAVYYR